MIIKLFNYITSNQKILFLSLVLYRCINSLLINTFFDPDEYWQSLEVAHKLVFGYGYLTWEWSEGLRSFIHPLIFVYLFKFLKFLNLDSTFFIIIGPKLLSGFLAAIGDLYLYKLTLSIFKSKESAKWALICQLISWYMFVCIVRTYSNSIETILFIISLYYFPINNDTINSKPKISIALTTFAFLIRPTTAIMWLYILPLHIFINLKSIKKIFNFLIFDCLFIGLLCLFIGCFIDYIYYERFVFLPYNFLYFNVLKNISSFYGTHPFHWYWSQGLPAIGFTILPLFLLSIRSLWIKKSDRFKLHLAWCALFTVGFYSLLAHKEFRFILPILPIIMMYSGYYISTFTQLKTTTKTTTTTKESKESKESYDPKSKPNISTTLISPPKLIILLLLLNIPMSVFFSNFHQRSPIDIMHYINSDIVPKIKDNGTISVDLLMSCHATPFQSYIHNENLILTLLECPPPLNENSPIDEKSLFYKDPLNFMNTQYKHIEINNSNKNSKNLKALPNYFIVEDELLDRLEPWLLKNSYRKEYHLKKPLDITSSTVFIRV
ncbi:hypothetical protein ACTFIW_001871 [Dictyostelium discoideum]